MYLWRDEGTDQGVHDLLRRQSWEKRKRSADPSIDVEIVERTPDDKGFVPQATRWIVEQANGILMFYRRLVRDQERPAHSGAHHLADLRRHPTQRFVAPGPPGATNQRSTRNTRALSVPIRATYLR
ncbi:hypothetical protein [Streptomyces anulatus]|uniref:hypothetical protein n=1 Tax=Streptomyces anulatus TaxID=1892 RepID=UPI003318B960